MFLILLPILLLTFRPAFRPNYVDFMLPPVGGRVPTSQNVYKAEVKAGDLQARADLEKVQILEAKKAGHSAEAVHHMRLAQYYSQELAKLEKKTFQEHRYTNVSKLTRPQLKTLMTERFRDVPAFQEDVSRMAQQAVAQMQADPEPKSVVERIEQKSIDTEGDEVLKETSAMKSMNFGQEEVDDRKKQLAKGQEINAEIDEAKEELEEPGVTTNQASHIMVRITKHVHEEEKLATELTTDDHKEQSSYNDEAMDDADLVKQAGEDKAAKAAALKDETFSKNQAEAAAEKMIEDKASWRFYMQELGTEIAPLEDDIEWKSVEEKAVANVQSAQQELQLARGRGDTAAEAKAVARFLRALARQARAEGHLAAIDTQRAHDAETSVQSFEHDLAGMGKTIPGEASEGEVLQQERAKKQAQYHRLKEVVARLRRQALLERQLSVKAKEAQERGQQQEEGDVAWVLSYEASASKPLRVTRRFSPKVVPTTKTTTVWDTPCDDGYERNPDGSCTPCQSKCALWSFLCSKRCS